MTAPTPERAAIRPRSLTMPEIRDKRLRLGRCRRHGLLVAEFRLKALFGIMCPAPEVAASRFRRAVGDPGIWGGGHAGDEDGVEAGR
jgi:hypothetical protein